VRVREEGGEDRREDREEERYQSQTRTLVDIVHSEAWLSMPHRPYTTN
jgi:hypothetical protein